MPCPGRTLRTSTLAQLSARAGTLTIAKADSNAATLTLAKKERRCFMAGSSSDDEATLGLAFARHHADATKRPLAARTAARRAPDAAPCAPTPRPWPVPP